MNAAAPLAVEEGPARIWRVRRASSADREAILALRRIVFGHEEAEKLDPAFWDWEFVHNHAGSAVIYVCEVPETGEVVGHYAVIPANYQLSGGTCRSSIVVDVMVHPDFRRQGMFVALAQEALPAAGEVGLSTSYGFPVRQDVMPGHLKAGWRVVTRLPVLARPYAVGTLAQRRWPIGAVSQGLGNWAGRALSWAASFPVAGSAHFTLHTGFPQAAALNELWDRAGASLGLAQRRTAAYLQWRYLHVPGRTYRVCSAFKTGEFVGYAVFRRQEMLGFDVFALVDWLVVPGRTLTGTTGLSDVLRALVSAGLMHEVERGGPPELLAAMVSPQSPWHRRLLGLGFLPTPSAFQFILHTNTPSASDVPPARSAWHLTWGDTDVV